MNSETFCKMETVYEACRNSHNQQVAIPLLKHIQFIDGEMYATVLDFCNGFGGKIDNKVKLSIIERMNIEN